MLQCIVVTPERTLCDRPADFVALTLLDGEIGIAPGHTPMIGRLGCGEMRIRRVGEGPTEVQRMVIAREILGSNLR